MAPMAARFLSKNQVLLPGSTLHVSGPPWRNAVRKVSGFPMAPARMSSRAFRCAPARRWFWSIMRYLPLFFAAATMRSQSSKVVAMGFSHSTCLPASSAATAISAWLTLDEHTLTASMAGSARSAS